MDNFDMNGAIGALTGIFTGIVALGVIISRFTKTDKDDKFFARLLGVFRSGS